MPATTYRETHVKRNPADGSVAIRTQFPEDEPALANQAWLQATTGRGAHFLRTSDVEDWDDLYTPPEPSTPSIPVGPA